MHTREHLQLGALGLLVAMVSGGCATTAAERCARELEPVAVPGSMAGDPRPAEAWLWPDDAALRLKLDPRGWAPLGSALAGVVEGMEAADLPPASVILQQIVPPPALEVVDHDRPAFLVVSAGSDPLLRACLGAGLPCTRQAWEVPIYARLLLPARDPSALEIALRETVAWPSRVVRHDGFVRLELAIGVVDETPPVTAELDSRAAGLRDGEGGPPDTPAHRAFTAHDGLLALHGDLGRVLGLAQHVGARSLGPSLAQLGAGSVAPLAQGTWILNLARSLDEPQRAEVGDATLLVGLAGAAPVLDVVGSRTPFGRRMATAAALTPEMTPSRVEAPIFALDWAMEPEAVGAADGVPGPLDEGPESLLAMLRPLGAWLLPGVARHPLGVMSSLLAPPTARGDGTGPPTLLALRVRAAPRAEASPEDEVLLRGGAAVLFAGGERTEGLLSLLRLRVAADPRYDMDVRRRGARVEMLVSYGAPIAEVFADAPATVDWAHQGVRVDLARLGSRPDFTEGLLAQLQPILPFPIGPGVPAWLPRAPLVLTLASDDATTGLRLGLGEGLGAPPAPSEAADTEQPEVSCLDLLFRELAPIVDAAAHGRRSASVLRVALDGVRATLDARVAGCAADDRDVARLAVAHVDWLRARLADHAGEPDEADRLDGRACEAGHCPACLDPRGAWPATSTTAGR